MFILVANFCQLEGEKTSTKGLFERKHQKIKIKSKSKNILSMFYNKW